MRFVIPFLVAIVVFSAVYIVVNADISSPTHTGTFSNTILVVPAGKIEGKAYAAQTPLLPVIHNTSRITAAFYGATEVRIEGNHFIVRGDNCYAYHVRKVGNLLMPDISQSGPNVANCLRFHNATYKDGRVILYYASGNTFHQVVLSLLNVTNTVLPAGMPARGVNYTVVPGWVVYVDSAKIS